MSERKYTYEQIVKALERCQHRECQECIRLYTGRPIEDDCRLDLIYDSLTLHKRQKADVDKLQEVNADLNESLRLAAEANKDLNAEIERLKSSEDGLKVIELYDTIETLTSELDAMRGAANSLKMHYENAKTEAIKEFAERLHKGIDDFRDKREMVMLPYTESALLIVERKIDNLVAEMTEGT